MREKNTYLDELEPKKISIKDLKESDYLITMGYEAKQKCPNKWGVKHIKWDIENPKNKSEEKVREITNEIEEKVKKYLGK